MPAERWPRPKQGGREGGRDFHRDLSHVANWTAVSEHKKGYYQGALQREVVERDRKREELSSYLAHMQSEEQARIRHKELAIAEEAKALVTLESNYKAELHAAAAKKHAKTRKFALSVDTQVEARRAKAAVGTRLRQLEDEQTIREHREEVVLAEVKAADRLLVVAGKNEETERYNKMNQERARAKKERENEEDRRLNRQAVELIDRREKERDKAIADLKARIEGSQRAYEDNAGAVEKAKAAEEETSRERWKVQHEKKLAKTAEIRAAKRMEGLLAQTASIDRQIEIHRERRDARMEENMQNGEEIRLSAVAFVEEEKLKKARALARELKNQQSLMGQIAEKRTANKNAMTPLEAMLNRDLLLSIASGKGYEPANIMG